MKSTFVIRSAASVLLAVFGPAATGAESLLSIESGVELSWPTTSGNTYQLQSAPAPAGPWTNHFWKPREVG